MSCRTCYASCTQRIPFLGEEHHEIPQENCLHCGLCFENCPNDTIERK